jgi:hypothetical protein
VRLTTAHRPRISPPPEILMTNPTREELFRLTAFARCAG